MKTSSEPKPHEDDQYQEWLTLYREALLELDLDKLKERIAAVEMILAKRQQAISISSDGLTERHAIEDALSSLRILKRDGR